MLQVRTCEIYSYVLRFLIFHAPFYRPVSSFLLFSIVANGSCHRLSDIWRGYSSRRSRAERRSDGPSQKYLGYTWPLENNVR